MVRWFAGWRLGCQRSEQAVTFQTGNGYGQHLSDDGIGRLHMGGLQIGGAADDLARLASRAIEQHINRPAQRGPVEGGLLAVDQVLKLHQSLVHVGR